MTEVGTESNSRGMTIAGIVLALTGLSHFVAPQLYEGRIETAVGLGLAVRKTRKIAVLGLLAYLLYMGVNVARNR